MLSWLISLVWKLDEFLKTELFELQGVRITVATLVALFLVLAAMGLFSRWLHRGLERAAERRGNQDAVSVAHTKRLASYLVWVLGAWLGLEAVGIRLDALLAAGAVFAVGLGIALQPDAESVLAGVILLFERTIRPGDTLLLDGEPVQVLHMRLRSSIVRNLDGQDIVLPNRDLVQKPIVHLTYESRRHRLRTAVRLALETDVDVAKGALLAATKRLDWGETGLDPEVRLLELLPSGGCWELQVWSEEPLLHEERVSALNEAVVRSLQEAGLDLAPERIRVLGAPG